jgi:hypothetical protein
MRVSVPDDVVMSEVEGEAVLLHLERGQYYSLDDVGTRMWRLMAEHGQIEAAVQALLEEYDVAEEDLRRDLMELVQALAAEGLLRLDEG